MKPNTTVSERISYLRNYYKKNSKMVLDRTLTPWICHQSQFLYTEGWKKSINAPTVRMRRSMAEAYMLSHSKPVICERELIVGQPDFSDFTDEEKKLANENEILYHDVIPYRRGREDHLALDYGLLLDEGI
jgi:hypothetical protein